MAEREFETSIEVLRGEGDDAEYVEVMLSLHFAPTAAEPDVGVGAGADDVHFTLSDGSPLPDDVAQAIRDDAKFEERELERALEDYAQDDGGRDDYDRDYD